MCFYASSSTSLYFLLWVQPVQVQDQQYTMCLKYKIFSWVKLIEIKWKMYCFTYGSRINGAIFFTVSRKLTSPQQMTGFWGWLCTFSMRNSTQRITATTASNAVDILTNLCVSVLVIFAHRNFTAFVYHNTPPRPPVLMIMQARTTTASALAWLNGMAIL